MRCPHAFDDGAYVLGSLSPEERRAFVAHLPGCPDCRTSVRALSDLPGLLGSVDTEETGVLGGGPLEKPPPSLLPRLLTVAQSEQARHRRKVRAFAIAACLLVLLALAVPVAMFAPFSPLQRSTQQSVQMQAMTPVNNVTAVTAEVGLVDKAWGTKIALHCAYAKSRYASEQAYGLYAISRSGQWEQIGSWTVGPGRDVNMDAATKFRTGELAAIEIRRSDGKTILRRRI